MIGRSELRIVCNADSTSARRLRQALRSFLDVFALERDLAEDILLAIGEVLSNAIEHGSDATGRSHLELFARSGGDDTLAIAVHDDGKFIERERLPNRGYGLRIVRAIARSVTIETSGGTNVEMVFGRSRSPVCSSAQR
ncbi:MAG TPA: ATP-binding protein [Candidatus Acidoferrales bacterium]|nr:ATP-binding protein [Candidatus Acidoferrales bacterium]